MYKKENNNIIFKKTNLVEGFTPTPSLVSLCSVLDNFSNKLKHSKKSFFKAFANSTTKTQHKTWCRGFTLVETMVAVLILTLTIVSLMTVVSNSLFAARYARNDITAGYLLQEVIDDIRNDRDTSVFLQTAQPIMSIAWTAFTTKYAPCLGPTGCFFDVIPGNTTITACTDTNCRKLFYNANAYTTPYYVYDDKSGNTGKVDSGFQRKIVVVQNGDEMQVTVTVFWKNGGLDKSRSLTNSLLKWQS